MRLETKNRIAGLNDNIIIDHVIAAGIVSVTRSITVELLNFITEYFAQEMSAEALISRQLNL